MFKKIDPWGLVEDYDNHRLNVMTEEEYLKLEAEDDGLHVVTIHIHHFPTRRLIGYFSFLVSYNPIDTIDKMLKASKKIFPWDDVRHCTNSLYYTAYIEFEGCVGVWQVDEAGHFRFARGIQKFTDSKKWHMLGNNQLNCSRWNLMDELKEVCDELL